MSPQMAAQFDWAMTGSFNPDQFQGEDRKRYEEERKRIEREYDERI